MVEHSAQTTRAPTANKLPGLSRLRSSASAASFDGHLRATQTQP